MTFLKVLETIWLCFSTLYEPKQFGSICLFSSLFSVLFFSSLQEEEDRNANSSGKLIEFDVLEEIRAWLARGLAIGKQFNAILLGESGTGKSTLLQQLEQLCQNQKPYVYCHRINCKQLIGEFPFASQTLKVLKSASKKVPAKWKLDWCPPRDILVLPLNFVESSF